MVHYDYQLHALLHRFMLAYIGSISKAPVDRRLAILEALGCSPSEGRFDAHLDQRCERCLMHRHLLVLSL